jgi:hypothetical protein
MNEARKCRLSSIGDYDPGDALRPPPKPHHLRSGGDKSGSLELDQERRREAKSVEQDRLGVSGGIAGEKFKGTLSFVHGGYRQFSRGPARTFFKGSQCWQTTHERTGLTVNFGAGRLNYMISSR